MAEFPFLLRAGTQHLFSNVVFVFLPSYHCSHSRPLFHNHPLLSHIGHCNTQKWFCLCAPRHRPSTCSLTHSPPAVLGLTGTSSPRILQSFFSSSTLPVSVPHVAYSTLHFFSLFLPRCIFVAFVHPLSSVL